MLVSAPSMEKGVEMGSLCPIPLFGTWLYHQKAPSAE